MHQHHHPSPTTPCFRKSLSKSGQVRFDNSFVEYSAGNSLRTFSIHDYLRRTKTVSLNVDQTLVVQHPRSGWTRKDGIVENLLLSSRMRRRLPDAPLPGTDATTLIQIRRRNGEIVAKSHRRPRALV